MKPKARLLLVLPAMLAAACLLLLVFGRPLWQPAYVKLTGGRTVAEAIAAYGPDAEARLKPRFEAAGAAYPPAELTLIGLKEEKTLELWARSADDDWALVHRYPVLAASGVAGPKLREGDRQVPEGIYKIESLNPNSSYHLSMKLDYPNAFDRARAREDGRNNPGTNIFIHGKAASVGCLAMGDPAIEELFIVVEEVGVENVTVLLLPHGPGRRPLVPTEAMPDWTAALYEALDAAAGPFLAGPD